MSNIASAAIAAVVSFIVAGATIAFGIYQTQLAFAPQLAAYGQSLGQACLDYETWVLDNIAAGRSDDEIAVLTMRAVQASARDQDSGERSDPSAAALSAVDEPEDDSFGYAPCQADTSAEVRSLVADIRAGR